MGSTKGNYDKMMSCCNYNERKPTNERFEKYRIPKMEQQCYSRYRQGLSTLASSSSSTSAIVSGSIRRANSFVSSWAATRTALSYPPASSTGTSGSHVMSGPTQPPFKLQVDVVEGRPPQWVERKDLGDRPP